LQGDRSIAERLAVEMDFAHYLLQVLMKGKENLEN
jgi:hypothetical protein